MLPVTPDANVDAESALMEEHGIYPGRLCNLWVYVNRDGMFLTKPKCKHGK